MPEELIGVPGEMRATIHIKRAATGETETYEIVGRPIAVAEGPPLQQEKADGSNP